MTENPYSKSKSKSKGGPIGKVLDSFVGNARVARDIPIPEITSMEVLTFVFDSLMRNTPFAEYTPVIGDISIAGSIHIAGNCSYSRQVSV